LDEIHPHWRRLSVIGEDVDAIFSVMKEWNAIQERLKRASYKMKLFMKEKLRELGFPKDTMLKPLLRKVATKVAPKRVKSTPKTRSTGRIPSRWESIDSQNPDSQFSHGKSNVPKSKGSRLRTCSRSQTSTPTSKKEPYLQIPYISQIPNLLRPYIEDIVNVRGDGNCGFRVIARHMGFNEEDHVLVRHALINELKNHKSDYLPIYGTEMRYKLILDGLHPPTSKSDIASIKKWLTSSDMGHIIATCCNRAVVLLTFPEMDGACETFFPIRSASQLKPHSNIMCLCLIPDHFLHVKLKEYFPLPPPCKECMTHKIGEVEKWHFEFMDRQVAFDDLMSKEPKPPKKPTNEHNPIVCDDTPTPEKKRNKNLKSWNTWKKRKI